MKPITVGTRVRYAAKFLRSTGQYTGPIPFARGTVTGLEWEGRLAVIDWGDPEIPTRVNVANLVREDRVHLED